MNSISFAQDSSYPVPPFTNIRLFYVQHSRNKNTVVYDINLKNGKPDRTQPVKAYWIRYSEKSQKEDLTFFQNKFAYGIKSEPSGTDSFILNFVSKKSYKIVLLKSESANYYAYTTINNRKAILKHIFIHITGGSALSPDIDYVKIFGIDAETNESISEKKVIK